MKELLKTLREEHRWLLERLEDPGNIPEIIDFLKKVHHPKEEQLLFPLMAGQPRLNEGGPRCGYFMGLRLEMAPQIEVRKRLEEFQRSIGLSVNFQPPPAWLTPQCPLSIPMEEHELCHNLANALRWLYNHDLSAEQIQIKDRLTFDFQKLLRAHIDKEDTCLFVLCESL